MLEVEIKEAKMRCHCMHLVYGARKQSPTASSPVTDRSEQIFDVTLRIGLEVARLTLK